MVLAPKKIAYDKYQDSLLINSTVGLLSDGPVYRQYGLLKTFLKKYRDLDAQETWLPITRVNISVKPGESSAIIPQLKMRLFKLEVPYKISPFFSASPFYRFYTQTAADYFVPYQVHQKTDEFYTSDYDLSDFTSQFKV